MDNIEVQILGTPMEYAREGDAGLDLRATEQVYLRRGEIKAIGTGVKIAIPEGYFGMVVPRSGAAKDGLGVANSPGIVDSGYRGEVKVLAYNMTQEDKMIYRGDRIAQIVFVPFASANFNVVGVLPDSERGVGGFGSTGVN